MKLNSFPRIIGVIFLCQFIISILYHQVLVGNFMFAGDDLSTIGEHKNSIFLGVFLHLIGNLANILAGLLLFQLLKKYNFTIAAWYLLFTVIEFFIHFLNGMEALILSDSPSIGEAVVPILKDRYYWTHMLVLILPLFTFPPFFYLLFKNGLVPKWIAGLGFIGSFLMPATVIAGLFGFGELMWLMLPLGLAQLALSIYLIIYGFKNYDYA